MTLPWNRYNTVSSRTLILAHWVETTDETIDEPLRRRSSRFTSTKIVSWPAFRAREVRGGLAACCIAPYLEERFPPSSALRHALPF